MNCLVQQAIFALILDLSFQSHARLVITPLKSANHHRVPVSCARKVTFVWTTPPCGVALTFVIRFFLRAENSIRHAAAVVSRWNVH